MAANTKELRARIRGVSNIQKITRAMEMVAATKLRRLQARAQGARPYADAIARFSRLLARASSGAQASPLTQARETVRRVALFVVSSDRGLCGSYNSNVLRAAADAREKQGRPVDLYLLGRKGLRYFRRHGEVRAAYEDLVEKIDYRRVRAIAEELSAAFLKGADGGGVDEVWMAYTRFVSMGRQTPTVERLLPIAAEPAAGAAASAAAERGALDLLLEPSPQALIRLLLPKSVIVRLFAAVLDSLASEFAARRAAMKAATDAAGDMIQQLRRQYNRARQEAITKELLDIIGGAEALKA